MSSCKKLVLAMNTELKEHHRNKESLMFEYVSLRLANSLNSYCSDLADSIDYLERRKEVKLIKRITK